MYAMQLNLQNVPPEVLLIMLVINNNICFDLK